MSTNNSSRSKRWVLHVDMDAFYSSVEQLDNPNYRGEPVIVGADPEKGDGRGVVSTASYEAREYGIHSAMPISRAYRLCPDAIYLPVRSERYQEVSSKIMNFLKDFTPLVEVASIDEAYLDLTGTERLLGPPKTVARTIKKEIYEKFRLVASVGLAPNKFLAKMASDLEKPDGFVVVSHEGIADFLQDLSIGKLRGIGDKTAKKLKRIGIETIGELSECPEDFIRDKFGKSGVKMLKLSQGKDEREVISDEDRKQISKEITFEKDLQGYENIKPSLVNLCEKVGFRMRLSSFMGRTIILKVRYSDFTTITRSKTITLTNHTQDIIDVILRLARQLDYTKKVRLVGVGVSNLGDSDTEPLSLFGDNFHEVEKAVDELKKKYGEQVLKRGISLKKGNSDSSD